ncbi:MAG: hypothetical protein ACJ8IR_04200 [Alphaproteobacteria bacterium]|jgi:hypothetical protein
MRIVSVVALTASVLALALSAQAQSQSAPPATQTAPAASQPAPSPPSPPPNPISTILTKITDMPPGWTRNMDGSYRYSEAGVRCPITFKTFTFERFQPPDKDRPDVLGICYYKGDTDRIGSIRVRRYPGASDHSALAENDRQLMSKDAPQILLHSGIDSKNGGGRATATVGRNGLLVDCSVWHPEHDIPRSDFLFYCTTLTGS